MEVAAAVDTGELTAAADAAEAKHRAAAVMPLLRVSLPRAAALATMRLIRRPALISDSDPISGGSRLLRPRSALGSVRVADSRVSESISSCVNSAAASPAAQGACKSADRDSEALVCSSAVDTRARVCWSSAATALDCVQRAGQRGSGGSARHTEQQECNRNGRRRAGVDKRTTRPRSNRALGLPPSRVVTAVLQQQESVLYQNYRKR